MIKRLFIILDHSSYESIDSHRFIWITLECSKVGINLLESHNT